MPQSLQHTIWALFALPVFIMGCKTLQREGDLSALLPEKRYIVTYDFSFSNPGKPTFVKAYIPKSNEHQRIEVLPSPSPGWSFSIRKDRRGHRAKWMSKEDPDLLDNPAHTQHILYQFSYYGRELIYTMEEDLPLVQGIPDSVQRYLKPGEHIQSEDSLIKETARRVSRNGSNMRVVLRRLYSYTYKIPRIKSFELMDAKTCLIEWQASCNGRSRLFVAMARSLGIPARLVGGMILKEGSKRTSHQWLEVYVHGTWIPFDALNGHFARIPANYMELYKEDEFLITHTPRIDFDYRFHIEPSVIASHRTLAPFLVSPGKDMNTLVGTLTEAGISLEFIKMLLFLPILGLVVTLFKNVVGLKTIGTFLSAILGISFHYSGLGLGLAILFSVILWVLLIYKPMDHWGMLQSPKLVVMLTGTVWVILLQTYLFVSWQPDPLSTLPFFPIIILTILSERFARKVEEDGKWEALQILGQTLVVALACYIVYSSPFLEALLFTFPELLLVIAGITLWVGNWIGLRLSEYIRFHRISLS